MTARLLDHEPGEQIASPDIHIEKIGRTDVVVQKK
jgi:hypothetical protein